MSNELSDKEVAKMFENVITVRKAITDHIEEKKLPRGCQGKLPCPICKTGEVSWSRASYNLHIHARCSTKDCVHWIE